MEADYAVKAATECWELVVIHPGCDFCNTCNGEQENDCHCEEEFKAKCIEASAAIIRRHVEPLIERHCSDAGCLGQLSVEEARALHRALGKYLEE